MQHATSPVMNRMLLKVTAFLLDIAARTESVRSVSGNKKSNNFCLKKTEGKGRESIKSSTKI